MKQKINMSGKDLLLAFLYSPGTGNTVNEPICGRTKLTKMMFLFEEEIAPLFFSELISELPKFIPYTYGPFSKELFDDLKFFLSLGFIVPSTTSIPISDVENKEFAFSQDESLDDDWAKIPFDNERPEQFELSYSLSENGTSFVEHEVWNQLSPMQKLKLQQFKSQINKISLDALLYYVYNKYPEQTTNSAIADKYLKCDKES